MRASRWIILLFVVSCVAFIAKKVPAATNARDAISDAGLHTDLSVDAGELSGDIARLRGTAAHIDDFVAGHLDPAIDANTLFDIDITQPTVISLEARRIQLLLAERDHSTAKAAGTKRATVVVPTRDKAGDAGTPSPATEIDPELWLARIDLDRARLKFYTLSEATRQALLRAHRAALGNQARSERALSDAERRAEQAKQDRQQALEAARQASSEAARLVSSELARLSEIQSAQAQFEQALLRRKGQITKGAEVGLALRSRAQSLVSSPNKDSVAADALYSELRKMLRETRIALAETLKKRGADTAVPQAGKDPFAGLAIDVDIGAVNEKRRLVQAEAQRITSLTRQFENQWASQLLDEMDSLNQARLSLLDYLSMDLREAITGFHAPGWDQAKSEGWHLALVLRYHRQVITDWLSSFRQPGRAWKSLAGDGAVVLALWGIIFGVFIWWRRRAQGLVAYLRSRVEELHTGRLDDTSRGERLLKFVEGIRGPLEWLVFILLLEHFLPAPTRALLEVQLFTVVLMWTVTGALVVRVVDSVAGGGRRVPGWGGRFNTAQLRFRSLQLIGRVVVVIGLVLVISSRLVGKGTIYQWVLSTCWLAAIPVFLVLVRWWRPFVFARIGAIRKKSAFEQWVLANQTGYKSFFAAMAGSLPLFAHGVWRRWRSWAGGFDFTRRALAYLFRRKLDRLESEANGRSLVPMPEPAYRSLGPDVTSPHWQAVQGHDALQEFVSRLRSEQGGIVAIVGERGMGKSTLLHRIAMEVEGCVNINVTTDDLTLVRAPLIERCHLVPETPLEEAVRTVEETNDVSGILVDNAHHLLKPVIGGLAHFDELMRVVVQHSRRRLWIFALDEVIWQFLERARDVQPLFDSIVRLDAWSEEDIVALIRQRIAEAHVEPNFETLVGELPADADEVDKIEAIERHAAGYYRILWDYAGGNPGVALHLWRSSLGVDAQGVLRVRVFQAPDTRELEHLPDSTIFVLKAVLQLSPAHPSVIAQATLLRPAQVDEALRYGVARGYLEVSDHRYTVTWSWFRTITRLLQRRHLLVAS